MHCSVRKWGTNSRVHSISGGDHQNIGPVDGMEPINTRHQCWKFFWTCSLVPSFHLLGSCGEIRYQPGEVNFVVTLQNCQHLQDITTKFSLCKICSEQSRGLCWGEMLRNLHVLPQFVSFIWFLKTLQISIYLPRVDQNVLVRDRSNQWASKIQFQCQATAALFVGCWSKDSLSFEVLEHKYCI